MTNKVSITFQDGKSFLVLVVTYNVYLYQFQIISSVEHKYFFIVNYVLPIFFIMLIMLTY